VLLEERCRKMRTMIKEKKKQVKSAVAEDNGEPHYTVEELERLQQALRDAESEKIAEEKKLKIQIQEQEIQVKSLQSELNGLNL
jgi:hypothetical protein